MIYLKKIKLQRYLLTDLPFLTTKKAYQRVKIPGIGRKLRPKTTFPLKRYKNLLLAKQQIQYNFALSTRCLRNYVNNIIKNKNFLSANTEQSKSKFTPIEQLLNLLYLRLDVILLGFRYATTILEARQMINHGAVLCNGLVYKKNVSVPITINTIISLRSKKETFQKQTILNNLYLKTEFQYLYFLEDGFGFIKQYPCEHIFDDDVQSTLTQVFEYFSIT